MPVDIIVGFEEEKPICMGLETGGQPDYKDLKNKPIINEEIVEGVKEGKDYSLQDRLIPGEGIEIIDNGDHTATIKVTGGGGEDKFFTFTQNTPAAVNKEYADGLIKLATELIAGVIKLNPGESITLNANGQLDVGGRLGQMPNTTGIYAPKTISPAAVGDGSFLLTEASGTSMGPKSLAATTGTNLTIRSAAAGATEYRLQNTYENRIKAALMRITGAVVCLSEADAKLGNYARVTSVKINGSDFIPDSSPNNTDQSADIVIKTERTANPSGTTTQLRVYGANMNFSTVHAGQGIGSSNGNGSSVIVGQAVVSHGGNANNLVGASIYNSGNGNTIVGRQHISRKNRWFMGGTGHDNTNGKTESGVALGEWSLITNDTAFVIGNGTSHTSRNNLFEIKTNGDVYINGVKKL